jgi:hypothetical protein
MRRYASLLGDDEVAADTLAESEHALRVMAAPSAASGLTAKMMTQSAVRRQRGSKKFGNA